MSDHLQSLKRFKSATSSLENTDSSTIASTYLCKHNTKYALPKIKEQSFSKSTIFAN